jgi:hypothetical protein
MPVNLTYSIIRLRCVLSRMVPFDVSSRQTGWVLGPSRCWNSARPFPMGLSLCRPRLAPTPLTISASPSRTSI